MLFFISALNLPDPHLSTEVWRIGQGVYII